MRILEGRSCVTPAGSGVGVGVGDGSVVGVFLSLLSGFFFLRLLRLRLWLWSWWFGLWLWSGFRGCLCLWLRLWFRHRLWFGCGGAEHGEQCGGEDTGLGKVVALLVAEDSLACFLSEVVGLLPC